MLSGRRALIVIVLLALGVRLLAVVWWERRLGDQQKFALADSESYWTLAKALSAGEPYEYGGPDARIFRTPAYPVVLAPILAAMGDTKEARWAARCLGAVLGSVSVGLVMVWTSSLFPDQRVAACAGLIAALYPGLVALSVIILSEALFCPLIAAHLLCWTRAEQLPSRGRWGWSAVAGLCAGLATLARPSWLLFVPFAGALSLLTGAQRRRRLAVLLIMFMTMCLTMAPWWIRNYRVVERFVPTTLQVGASLYDGLNPNATGASNMEFADDYYRAVNAERLAGELPAGSYLEVVLDQRLKRDAIAWAKDHPTRALQLAATKFARMWNVWPNDEQFRSPATRLIIATGYLPVFVCAAIGLWKFRRRGFVIALCVLPALYLTLLHVIFVSSLRYREPAMMGGIVLAAGVICGTREKWRAELDRKVNSAER